MRHQRNQPAEQFDRVAHQRLDLDALLGDVRHDLGVRPQVWFGLEEIEDADPVKALHDQAHAAVRRLQQAVDQCGAADGVEIVRARQLDPLAIFADCQQPDHAGADRRLIDQLNRARLLHGQRQHSQRVYDRAAQRQDRQIAGNGRSTLSFPVGILGLAFA